VGAGVTAVHCVLLMCEVCRETTAGRTYIGYANTTVSGRQCQRWSSNTPHHINRAFLDNGFPDGSSEAAENYCRNPDKDYLGGVWCYTTDVDVHWESCDVPECGEPVFSFVLFTSFLDGQNPTGLL